MRIDHVTLEQAYARARRERAETVYRLIIQPIVRLFTHKAEPVAHRKHTFHARHA